MLRLVPLSWRKFKFTSVPDVARRTASLQITLIAVAFWTLAVIALTNLRYLHLWGMPQVEVAIAWATMACCALLLGLVGAQRLIAWRKSGSLVSLRGALGGTPGMLLFGAVASYLAIGAAVLGLEAIREPDTLGLLKYHVLLLGVLAAAAVGGRAALERTGVDRLLRGVLIVLIAGCAIILASPFLRDLGILPPYRIPFRLTGAFVNPNDAGLAACITVALAAAFLTNGGSRTLGWLGFVAGIAAGLGTASRTAFVVLGALAVAFLLLNVRSKPRTFFLAWATTGLIGIAGFVGVVSFFGGFSEWWELRDDPQVTHEGSLSCDPTDNPGADCAVLLATRDILAGDVALNWSSAVPMSRWQGVTVDGPEERVTGLDLAGLGLNGRIPPELGSLDRLVSLLLPRNRLTGRIPPELGNLASLEYLLLNYNALTGGIPPELAKLGRLKELRLRGNRLTGAVPVALGELDLSVLHLWGNDFDSLPPELTAIADHDLANTRLCTPLPPTSPALFDDCTTLLAVKETLAGETELNWHAAVPIGLWQGVTVGGAQERVIALNLAAQGLTGRIPPELGSLDGLVTLNLAINRLTGPIPPELGRLVGLRKLSLDRNDLTGPVPPGLIKVPENTLAVCQPLPRGSPALFDDCTLLLAMKDTLAGNAQLNWSEALPISEWQGVTVGGPEGRVIALELPRIRLNGRIPAALGHLAGLRSLALDGNALAGPIPPELGKLTDLEILGLAANALTGPIPPELAQLSSLRELWLSGNRLTGSLPPELRSVAGGEAPCPAAPADNPGLRADCLLLLALRDSLAGDARLNWSEYISIKSWQGVTIGGSLERVTQLELSRSGLTGRIPPALGRLSQLVSLNLSHNRLTGPIPPALGQLSQLRELRLWNNRLRGPVPAELEGLEKLTLLRLDGNDLDRPYPRRLFEVATNDFALDGRRRLRPPGEAGTAAAAARRTNGERSDAVRRLFCRPAAGSASGLQADCALLLAGRDILAGAARLNWREDIPIEFWQGVTVGGSPKRVTALELPRAGLTGRLFAELGELGGLVALNLGHNRLTGAVPPELEGLDKLFFLRLAGNDLDRPVPAALYEVVDHDLHTPVFCRPREIDPGLLADCTLLLTVRDRLAGDAPLNWRRAVPVDDWQGVTVDRSCDCVTALALTQMGLNGHIPAELGQLAGLVSLRLGRNRLTGAIPPELGNLVSLRRLALDGNLLVGSVPPALGKLSRLTDLWLHGNRLRGPAPPAVVALPELVGLRLDDDDAAGELPAQEHGRLGVSARNLLCQPLGGALSRLHDDCATLLDVRDVLAGDVELNWSDAVPISYWRGVTVGLPASAGEAEESPRIVALDLSHMGLNGQIPGELSALDGLAVLRLGHNRLAGPIPPALGALTGLQTLSLENNALTGMIPEELGALRGLVSLRLGNNELTGPMWQFITLANLRVLALENNLLPGNIDPHIDSLSRLEELRLENNRLQGEIPPKLNRLTRLVVLRLGGNAFADCVPATAPAAQVRHNDLASADLLCESSPWSKPDLFEDGARLMSMRDILAGDAALNWSYARPVASWQGVTVGGEGRIVALDLRGLNLSGRLPGELGELSHLYILRLDGNRLTGAIPPELANLTRLTMLSLDGNGLTGPIPPELVNLLNLGQLWLADNRLTGSIPPELTAGIKRLSLAVAGNDFYGCLPRELSRRLRSHDIDDGLICAVLTMDRPSLWRLGFEKAMEAPVLGHGFWALKYLDGAPIGNNNRPLGVHNLYLTLLGEAGIVPLLLFVSALVLLLRAQWAAPQSLARDVTVAWVIVIVLYGMSFQHLLGLGAFMFLAGLSVATAPAAGQTTVTER